MAPKVTSSAQRSKGKAKKPVTTTKGRANRQSVSTAKPTNSSNRPANAGARVTNSAQRTNTGSARVTGTAPAARPALPSGQRGGALATQADVARMRGGSDNVRGGGTRTGQAGRTPAALPSGQRGGAITTRNTASGLRGEQDRVSGSGTRTGQPGRTRPALPPAKPPAAAAAPKPAYQPPTQAENWLNSRTGKTPKGQGIASAVGAAVGNALAPYARAAGEALGTQVRQRFGNAAQRSETQARTTNAPKQGPAAPQRRASTQAPTPARRASTSGGGSSSAGRTSGGGSSAPAASRPAPSRPAARPAAPAMPSAVTKAAPTATAPKAASKGPNIGPTADGASYGKAVKLQSKIDGTSDNDMKRRRAFLDAKDSMAGAKAVRELQEKRKKKLAGMLSSETTIAPSKQQS